MRIDSRDPNVLRSRSRPAVLLFLVAVAGLFLRAFDSTVRAEGEEPIRLVVLVVIDQLRGDALRRFDPIFGSGGFRRLRDGGVVYENAHFTHAHTVTAVGHATIGTGASPAVHGLIGNDWIDRSTGRSVNCVSDAAYPTVGTASETGNAAPTRLLASTFADEWVITTSGRGRAFGVSIKDRGAILPVGKSGKAFWYNSTSGRMVSSRYYYDALPEWAAEFSNAKPAEKYSGTVWERATRDDDGVPTAPDDRSFETDASGLGRTFPHRFAGEPRTSNDAPGTDEGGDGNNDAGAGRRRGGGGGRFRRPTGNIADQVKHSPFGDEIVLDFALKLLDSEQLGKGAALDILSISFSSNDIVGHAYGPDSVEAKEMAWWLDRHLTRLLVALDERFPNGEYILALTSDHGVGYPPEAVAQRKFATTRVTTSEITNRIRRKLNFTVRYLDWTAGFSASGFYFDPEAIVHGGKSASELEAIAATIIRDETGIADAYTRSDILAGRVPATEIGKRVLSGYHPERSPDVFVVIEPYCLEGTTTASHGTPHSYDSHVPLLFYGAGITPHRTARPVDIRDLAPTLTAILGSSPPSGSQGTPLPEVLDAVKRLPLRK
jgi:predicted AlkP superfamily pyrophosphatase or phosphodiesterase